MLIHFCINLPFLKKHSSCTGEASSEVVSWVDPSPSISDQTRGFFHVSHAESPFHLFSFPNPFFLPFAWVGQGLRFWNQLKRKWFSGTGENFMPQTWFRTKSAHQFENPAAACQIHVPSNLADSYSWDLLAYWTWASILAHHVWPSR